MLNPSFTRYPKEPDFLRSQPINIVGWKWAHKWTKRSLGKIFTSLAGFPFKHGATVVKGSEKLLDIWLENIRPKLLFTSNWKSTIRTWLVFATAGQINHAQWTRCDPAILSAHDCFIPGHSRCTKTTTPRQCTFSADGLTPSRPNVALAAVGLGAKRRIEGSRQKKSVPFVREAQMSLWCEAKSKGVSRQPTRQEEREEKSLRLRADQTQKNMQQSLSAISKTSNDKRTKIPFKQSRRAHNWFKYVTLVCDY